MDFTQYYTDQANGLQGYSGSRFQKGHGIGSMFKSIARWIIPIIKNYAEPMIQNAIKGGVQEISTGVSKFNEDIQSEKDIKESASKRFKETVDNIKKKIQKGSGKRIKSRKGNCKRVRNIFEKNVK